MTTYIYGQCKELIFKPVSTADGGIELTVVTYEPSPGNSNAQSAPALPVGHGDVVADEITRDAGATPAVTQVKLCVEDLELATSTLYMMVQSTESSGDWSRNTTVSPNRSERNVAIPTTSGDETILAMLILAKTSTTASAAVARRSQTVIIKHRPSP